MKLTVNELMKKISDAAQQRARLEAELQEIEREAEKLQEEAETAAEKGNEAAYISKTGKLAEAQARVNMRKIQLDRLKSPYSPEEVQEAFTDYAAKYEKEFDALEAEMEKAIQKTYECFCKLVNKQNEGLKVRRDCGALLGLTTTQDLRHNLRMKLIDTSRRGPGVRNSEAQYFIEKGLEPTPDYYNGAISRTVKIIINEEPQD